MRKVGRLDAKPAYSIGKLVDRSFAGRRRAVARF